MTWKTVKHAIGGMAGPPLPEMSLTFHTNPTSPHFPLFTISAPQSPLHVLSFRNLELSEIRESATPAIASVISNNTSAVTTTYTLPSLLLHSRRSPDTPLPSPRHVPMCVVRSPRQHNSQEYPR